MVGVIFSQNFPSATSSLMIFSEFVTKVTLKDFSKHLINHFKKKNLPEAILNRILKK
jgi:hypothetical protein